MSMSKLNYEVIDNFLPEGEANQIKYTLMNDEYFPWYCNHTVVDRIHEDFLENYQFTHTFYKDYTPVSSYMALVAPLVEKINPLAIMRIKANLGPIRQTRVEFPYHTDFKGVEFGTKTAIYYVNTNNGVTILKDGTEIESVANRLVIFDQNIPHTGTTCSDQKFRCLINLNYINRE